MLITAINHAITTSLPGMPEHTYIRFRPAHDDTINHIDHDHPAVLETSVCTLVAMARSMHMAIKCMQYYETLWKRRQIVRTYVFRSNEPVIARNVLGRKDMPCMWMDMLRMIESVPGEFGMGSGWDESGAVVERGMDGCVYVDHRRIGIIVDVVRRVVYWHREMVVAAGKADDDIDRMVRDVLNDQMDALNDQMVRETDCNHKCKQNNKWYDNQECRQNNKWHDRQYSRQYMPYAQEWHALVQAVNESPYRDEKGPVVPVHHCLLDYVEWKAEQCTRQFCLFYRNWLARGRMHQIFRLMNEHAPDAVLFEYLGYKIERDVRIRYIYGME